MTCPSVPERVKVSEPVIDGVMDVITRFLQGFVRHDLAGLADDWRAKMEGSIHGWAVYLHDHTDGTRAQAEGLLQACDVAADKMHANAAVMRFKRELHMTLREHGGQDLVTQFLLDWILEEVEELRCQLVKLLGMKKRRPKLGQEPAWFCQPFRRNLERTLLEVILRAAAREGV